MSHPKVSRLALAIACSLWLAGPVFAQGLPGGQGPGIPIKGNPASSGPNSDITSLTGLTTPLSIPQGGCGATTAAGCVSNLGLAPLGTSGATTPLNNGNNTESGYWTFSDGLQAGLSPYPNIVSPIIGTATGTAGAGSFTLSSGSTPSVGMAVYASWIAACSNAEAAYRLPVVTGVAGSTISISCKVTTSEASPTAVQFGQSRYDATSNVLTNTLGAEYGLFGGASQGNSTWVSTIGTLADYRTANAINVLTPPGGGGAIFAGSRTSDASGVATALPIACVFLADTWSSAKGGWCQYLQSNLSAATAGLVPHFQTEASIDSLWPTKAEDPWTISSANVTVGERTDCGTGQNWSNIGAQIGPFPNNCGVAFDIVPNGAQFETGFVVAQSALDTNSGIATVGGIVGGSGGANGTYTNVPLLYGHGSGALATITVSGGTVTGVTVTTAGGSTDGNVSNGGYEVNDVISAAPANIGNVTGFSAFVSSIVDGKVASFASLPSNVGINWYSGPNNIGSQIYGNLSGGFPTLWVNQAANGSVQFASAGTAYLGLNSTVLYPTADNVYSLGGSTSTEWANVYTHNLYVGANNVASAWTTYTPTLTWTGGTPSSPAISGCAYKQVGKMLNYRCQFTPGATLNGATGVTISIPLTSVSGVAQTVFGLDAGTQAPVWLIINGATTTFTANFTSAGGLTASRYYAFNGVIEVQ